MAPEVKIIYQFINGPYTIVQHNANLLGIQDEFGSIITSVILKAKK